MNFTTTAATAVKLPGGSKIVLADGTVNTITSGDSDLKECLGIYAVKDLTISGFGKLTVTGGNATGPFKYSSGILSDGNVTITGSAEVIVNGGTSKENSSGILAYGGGVTITGSADVTAKGGNASSYSRGIYAKNDVVISGGSLKAESGRTNDRCYAIFTAYGDVSISGGTVIAKAGSALNKAPSQLPTTYQWRISESGDYSAYPGSAYTWDASHTYLDIQKAPIIVSYTVFFNVNGGTGTMANVIGVSGDYTLPANGFTAPAGKQFKCWNVGGAEKAVCDKITVTTNTTVIAVWEDIPVTTYTVSFDANGGDGTMSDVTGVSGTYALPANSFTAPAGKQFKGWATSADGAVISGTSITVSADTTLYAIWENIPAASKEYDILDGANSKWTQNSNGSLSIRGSGAFSKFVGVKVDGTLVDAKNYTGKEGSTIVTLKADYLKTLAAGSHNIERLWTDGSASTRFTVDAKATVNKGTATVNKGTTAVNKGTRSPKTGDNSHMALWITLFLVSGALISVTGVYGKKKKRTAR